MLEEKRAEKAAKKEAKQSDITPESIQIVEEMKSSTEIVIPAKIQKALESHRKTFETIFSRHK